MVMNGLYAVCVYVALVHPVTYSRRALRIKLILLPNLLMLCHCASRRSGPLLIFLVLFHVQTLIG